MTLFINFQIVYNYLVYLNFYLELFQNIFWFFAKFHAFLYIRTSQMIRAAAKVKEAWRPAGEYAILSVRLAAGIKKTGSHR